MRKVFNFSPGPAMLPEEVLLQAQQEMLDWHGTGMSIMEIGHRGEDFTMVAQQTEADLRELMEIPDDYSVLFVTGGATAQFAMVPINLLGSKKTADYIDTGIWSKKAIDEAKRYAEVNVAAKTILQDGKFAVPPQSAWNTNPEAAYLHYTPNETIEGVEIHWVPQTDNIPLVADMTSCILSKPIQVKDYGVIYAGAQKNMGHAGITVVIIRNDLLKDPLPGMPSLYSYKLHAENKSFYNTPPTYAWYFTGLVLSWMRRHGGVRAFAEMNLRKAKKLYGYIDANQDFYINPVHPDYRSIMNVPFNLALPELTDSFLELSHEAGLTNLRGHRLAGGLRASMYNAMPEAGVDALIAFMTEFKRKA